MAELDAAGDAKLRASALNVKLVPIDTVVPGDETLSVMEEAAFKNYVAHIVKHGGPTRPVIVMEVEGKLRITDGHKTWRATVAAGFGEIQASVIKFDDIETADIAGIGYNTHGTENPLAAGRRIDAWKRKQASSAKKAPNTLIARLASRDEKTIRNFLMYWDLAQEIKKLPPGIQELWPSDEMLATLPVRETTALAADFDEKQLAGTLAEGPSANYVMKKAKKNIPGQIEKPPENIVKPIIKRLEALDPRERKMVKAALDKMVKADKDAAKTDALPAEAAAATV